MRDRSRSTGRTLRAVTRTVRRRSGEAKAEVLALTARAGELLVQSIAENRRLVLIARHRPRPRREGTAEGSRGTRAARGPEIVARSSNRVAGQPISDRLVSMSDRDAGPMRKGKLGKPNAFGY